MMKRFLLALPLLAVMLWLNGCYHVGSIMHPQIHTIAIAPVENNTVAYNVSAEMRQLLSEQFMLDGSLKVVSLEEADCILYARVINVAFTEVSGDSYDNELTYRPKEWNVIVDSEFSVIIPGQAEPLVSTRKVSGNTDFQVQADMQTNRRRAILQAARNAAQTIVSYTTEAW
ncbi:LPS assembly lipoprotein LptE [Victivallis sp. Marseille-Q1083]|uniref:LPS assembly lipoprotein LptE n=1 Tax=Victivallis sp. Marseille-Q1083 TaxID=2717288 RepID=UPI00158866FD|nr:LPS assembly lipoprotein LptE [Victivallis sp. Marseille-Q1083]